MKIKIPSNKPENSPKTKPVEFSNLSTLKVLDSSFLILPRPIREKLNKLKFHRKNKGKNIPNQSYAQASSSNIKEILKIKDFFPQLSNKKVEEIHKTMNDTRPNHVLA